MRLEMEHISRDTVLAFLFGLLGGMLKIILDAPLLLDSYMLALLKAGITALVCGFLGVAGKKFFGFLWTLIKSKNKKNGKVS